MNIVLAWKNALYQETFSKEQRSMLVPENPVGMLNLTDEDLANVQGGNDPGLGASVGTTTTSVGNGLTGAASGLTGAASGLTGAASGLTSGLTGVSGGINGAPGN